jgi:hypothetical protein
MLQLIWTILLSTASCIAIVCFILILCLECNLVIFEDTYIVYWFGGCFLFVGSSVIACCCLVQLFKVEDLHLQLDLLVIIACFCSLQLCRVGVLHPQLELYFLLCGVQVLHPQFNLLLCRSSLRSKFRCHNFISICSLMFIVCSLQVIMFDYFDWHARHMFRVPSVLGMQFGNHWRYISCLLVQWLLLVRWFVDSSVVDCCCLVQVCEFEVLRLQLGMFMLPHWFVACCFLLFDSTLQGSCTDNWSCFFCTLRCLGPAPASGPAVLSFSMSGEVEI